MKAVNLTFTSVVYSEGCFGQRCKHTLLYRARSSDMQFPISQAMVHCDGKWELHEERRARYNSPSLPPLVEGISHNSRHTREGACAIYRKKKALKSWVRVHGMMAIHCYISLFAPHATPTSHRNVPLLAKWEIVEGNEEGRSDGGGPYGQTEVQGMSET